MKGTRRIGVIGFDGVNGIDLVGPLEAFAHVAQCLGADASPYETVVIGIDGRPFAAESGVIFQPHCAAAEAPPLDTLIVPGGHGLRLDGVGATVAAWIGARADGIRRIASVCTGIYGLAPSGLLDGCRVATHWRLAADVATRFPKLDVDGDAIYIKQGQCYTSGGVTAGIDLALALIEEDLGPKAALAVARELLVYVKRVGGQSQYSEPLQFQARAADRFADLVAWISANLDQDLSVGALAARACLGPRQFGRRFADALGCTPADYVAEARLSEARRRLGSPDRTVGEIAHSLGYASADAFRRAFERRFGLNPSAYRERFALDGALSSTPTRI